jgi:D-2-hydroxyacid dehydrogenase (NADP+)
MAQILLKEKIDKDFRFVAENKVSLDDLLWVDAYVGFRPTKNFQFGNMKWEHSLGAGVDSFLFNMFIENSPTSKRSVGGR